ncbi:class F sortase [Blastococcus deserti]|uniref:Class F sortase n=1 Tax=Blastococcus deserti TaxID=2259033 RepID=A0ABW4XF75_9ACTN
MFRSATIALNAALLLTGLALVAHHGAGAASPDLQLAPGGASAEHRALSPAEDSMLPPGTHQPGIPVRLQIPFPSTHHPQGVTAEVSADPLTPEGNLFVPPDPRTVSWAREDAAPGAGRGTAILTGHVNYVVDGELVVGALSDLAEYAVHRVGQTFTVVLADGRELAYRITGGEQYDKDELAARPELRQELYDQANAFGEGTGRLVLVSCGGAFDSRTGNYEDNVFLFALPVT